MNEHADVEALSALVDGEAPEWEPHVAACRSCRSRVEDLRTVQAAVGAPVDGGAADRRDRAIAAAMSAAPEARRPPSVQGRRSRWLAPASIAAAFLLVVGAAALLTRPSPSGEPAAVAGRALQESAPPSTERVGAGAATSSAAPGGAAGTTPGDLGEIPDSAALLARARAGLVARDASLAPDTTATAASGQSRAAAPNQVGTRPCEEQTRSREPALREVVYFATATRQGVPAFVPGFSTGPAPAPLTLLMLARDGCGVLLRAAGP